MSDTKNILLFGFYLNNNIGDDLFVEAFKYLFPNYNFTPVNTITNLNYDAIFIGGGSFLDQKPSININLLPELINKKIFYIGVGAETKIDETHKLLLNKAKLIATRNGYLQNSLQIPDLIHCLPVYKNTTQTDKVLIIPNITTVPCNSDPYYMHSSWNNFKTQISEFIDNLKVDVHYLPMCVNDKLNDLGAIYEIINSTSNKNYKSILNAGHSYYNITNLFCKYSFVISQRYHGHVIAEACKIPNFTIYHHDKLKTDNSICYYNVSKDALFEKFYNLKNNQYFKPINLNIFKELVEKVNSLI
jgi:polysaccharide pyruvyl transferase WcaK-like protein